MTRSAAWSSDLLDRKSDALFLIDFIVRKLDERERRQSVRSFVLNIDAGWGQGKTYFLENLRTTLQDSQYVVAYINAWRDDHAEDPLLSVMNAIEGEVSGRSAVTSKKPLNKFTRIGGQVAAAAAKGLVKQTITRYAGEDTLKELSELIGSAGADATKSASEEAAKKIGEIYDSEGKLLLEKFRLGQKTILEFKKQMAELVASFKPEYKKPLFVLVDELDRCRPPYAVALLERIKHLFDVDDVVFVMATDTEQLRHSIAALYGVNFAAGRYLLRFFDQTYRFEDAAIDDFVRQQFSDIDQSKLYGSPELKPAEFSARAFKAFNLSLRDVEQCTDIIRNCVTAWSFKNPIVLLVLVPLVILQQQRMEVSYGTIRERLSERLGPIRWVNLDFYVRDQNRRHLFDGLDLLQQFVDLAISNSIPQITNEQDGPAAHRVIREILIHEMSARFPGGYPSYDPPMSVVRGYPAFVRSVGRLTPG